MNCRLQPHTSKQQGDKTGRLTDAKASQVHRPPLASALRDDNDNTEICHKTDIALGIVVDGRKDETRVLRLATCVKVFFLINKCLSVAV